MNPSRVGVGRTIEPAPSGRLPPGRVITSLSVLGEGSSPATQHLTRQSTGGVLKHLTRQSSVGALTAVAPASLLLPPVELQSTSLQSSGVTVTLTSTPGSSSAASHCRPSVYDEELPFCSEFVDDIDRSGCLTNGLTFVVAILGH